MTALPVYDVTSLLDLGERRTAQLGRKTVVYKAMSTSTPVLDQGGLIAAIDAIGQACSANNWDGYGAIAVTHDAVARAKGFAHALPTYLETPDVVPEPDGEISFDWQSAADRMFSVSISVTGRLAFLSVNGTQPPERGLLTFQGRFPADLAVKAAAASTP